MDLQSYLEDRWQMGQGEAQILENPTTQEPMARATAHGLSRQNALAYARSTGGDTLRSMTFAERGKLLSTMAKAIHEHREELLDLSTANGGNTRSDAKFDVDGATGTLAYYAKQGQALGERRWLADDDSQQLSRSPKWVGRHVLTPRQGVAVHINAFNFPAWGLAEKAATALLAGMPVLSKPATSTAIVATRMMEILTAAKVLPNGVLSLLAGEPGDLLDHMEEQDVLAFTGSAATASRLRLQQNLANKSVRINVEADSLNAAVLGPDIDHEGETYDVFIRQVCREITQKAGQKCTAIRRIFVPSPMIESVCGDLRDELKATRVGDPSLKEVSMGPLNSAKQHHDVQAVVRQLLVHTTSVLGEGGRGEPVGVQGNTGYFMTPTLLVAKNARSALNVHTLEAFGPVATVLPYDGTAKDACELVAMGRGSLVASVYSDDEDFAMQMILGLAPFHGRLHIACNKVAEHAMGPGTVLPQLTHGGPGRAGGGEELGGLRGLQVYMQRTAVSGYSPWLDKLS